jgi:trehalose 6-phosphate synthase
MIQVSSTPLRAVLSIPPKGFTVSRPATPRQSPPRRLVVVSNRVALPGSEPSGGLAHGLRALLAARGGLWVGWSGRHGEQEDLHLVAEGKVEYLTLDLPRDEFDLYYREFANRALWPVLHDRSDLVACTARARAAYLAVNQRFARLLSRVSGANDMVWIQDYHLIPLGRMLRERGIGCRLGFFLHTPMASAEHLARLPGHEELLRDLSTYDVVGLQTGPDAEALAAMLEAHCGAEHRGAGELAIGARRVQVRAFPIGVDPDALAALGDASATRPRVRALRESLAGRALMIAVDRLDYSKGIPERIAAYGELLEGHPAHRHGVTFLQVAPESRCDVPEYQRLGQQVQRQVGRINGRHGDEAWTPLRYVNRSYPHEDLAGFYRLARVGLVTPLRDGMNLVAKEFVACQDGADPGVLVLSRYAGAARELDSALQVDPADTRGCAEAIACALSMPREERRERWRAAMARLREATIHGWGERFVAALEGSAGAPLALPSRLVRLSRRQQKERERGARAVADAGPLADQASA